MENVITLQKSQEALEVDTEKKTMMKKMMVWEPHAGLQSWVGRRCPHPPIDEIWLEVPGQWKRQDTWP